MTLLQIINELLKIGGKQKNVNYTGEGDIYTLNANASIDYGVFFITQNQHTQDENTITYSLNLYYIDRLLENEQNTLPIQSTGMIVLGNIINKFNESVDECEIEYSITYQPFTHRFADACAGVYAVVNLTVDNNIGVCSF